MKSSNLKAVTFTAIFMFFVAFQGKTPAPKTYNISLPLTDWTKYSNGLQYTINRIRQSDLPSKEVAAITDSVLFPLLVQINDQVGKQLEAERKKELQKQKPDTTQPKKN